MKNKSESRRGNSIFILIIGAFIMLANILCYIPNVKVSAQTKNNLVNTEKSKTNTQITVQKSVYATTNSNNQNKNNQNKNNQSKNLQYSANKKYTTLCNQIKLYLKNKKGKYGVYFVSLKSGGEFGINDTEGFTAASTTKMPLNLYVYNQIVKKKINPNKKLTYTLGDYQSGTGGIQYASYGKTYSIKELQKLSIVTSDNVAKNMLQRYCGKVNILNFEEGLVKHKVNRYSNVSCPKDMAVYFKELLKFQKAHPKEAQEFLYNLEHTIFNDRIPKYLPKDVIVAHKIGNVTGCSHDVGIVFAKRPFIITIMSKNTTESREREVIGRISGMVYDYEQKCK